MEKRRCLRSDTAKQWESLVQGGFCEGGNGGEKLSDAKYTSSPDRALDNDHIDQKPGKKMKKGKDLRKGGNGAVEKCEEKVGEKRKRVDLMDSKSVSNEGVLGSKTKNPSSPEIEKKKEICGLAPIVGCPQINGKMSESCIQEDDKMSESCIQKDAIEQDIHLGEGCEGLAESGSGQSIMSGQQQQELELVITGIPHSQNNHDKHTQHATTSEEANVSPNSEFVFTKEQQSDSGKANGSPSTDISENITLVKTIYSKRKENLLANQSKKSIQFREARDRIEKESIANLRVEHLHKCALVRKMHSEIDVRVIKLKAVDKDFVSKVELIKYHLNEEQEKLDSAHKAERDEEEVLKYHWLQEAKCGRSVDAFFNLPHFLNSCFDLDGMKRAAQVHLDEPLSQVEQFEMSTTANSPSEPFLSNSSTNDTSVLLHAMQLEWHTHMDSLSELVKSNQSEGDIPLAVQLERPVQTDEPGSGTSVSENSLLCQPGVRVENHVQFLKFEENLERIRRKDRAEPVKFCEELKVCINTDFEKDLMEDIRKNCSKSIHDADTALAQMKIASDTSFNRVTGTLGSHQGAHLGPVQNRQLSDRPRVAPAAATTSNLPGPATSPPLIGVTANVYDILPHYYVYRRKK